ncbi:hypothetical protein KAT92_03990 [Candidatus Babeliales bacterium]|nr:hypothetical protein [Candidatus Babeliales bacterium]
MKKTTSTQGLGHSLVPGLHLYRPTWLREIINKKKTTLYFLLTIILIPAQQENLHAFNAKAVAGFGVAASSAGSAILARRFFKKSREAGRMLELRRSQSKSFETFSDTRSMETLMLQQQRYRTLAWLTAAATAGLLVGGVTYGVKNLDEKKIEEKEVESDEYTVRRIVRELEEKHKQNPEESDEEYDSDDEDDTGRDRNPESQPAQRTALEKSAERFNAILGDGEKSKEEGPGAGESYSELKKEKLEAPEVPDPRLDSDSEDEEENALKNSDDEGGPGGAIAAIEKRKLKKEYGIEVGRKTYRKVNGGGKFKKRSNDREEKKGQRTPLDEIVKPPEE